MKEVLATCQALMTVPTIMNSDIFKISSHWREEGLSFAIKNKNILYIFLYFVAYLSFIILAFMGKRPYFIKGNKKMK